MSAGAIVQFSYSPDGNVYTEVGAPFFAQPGRWIGAEAELFALSTKPAAEVGYADFDWFRIE